MQCNATNFLGWISVNFPDAEVESVTKTDDNTGFKAIFHHKGETFEYYWKGSADPRLGSQMRSLPPERKPRPVESRDSEPPVGRSFAIHVR